MSQDRASRSALHGIFGSALLPRPQSGALGSDSLRLPLRSFPAVPALNPAHFPVKMGGDLLRRGAASLADPEELDQVHASVSQFDAGDEGPRYLQSICQLALGQLRSLSQLDQTLAKDVVLR